MMTLELAQVFAEPGNKGAAGGLTILLFVFLGIVFLAFFGGKGKG